MCWAPLASLMTEGTRTLARSFKDPQLLTILGRPAVLTVSGSWPISHSPAGVGLRAQGLRAGLRALFFLEGRSGRLLVSWSLAFWP